MEGISCNLTEMAEKFTRESNRLESLKTFFNDSLNLCEDLLKVASKSQLKFPLDSKETELHHVGFKEIVKELMGMEESVTGMIKLLKKEIVERFDLIEKNYNINSKGFIQKMQHALSEVQNEKRKVEELKSDYFKAAGLLNNSKESADSIASESTEQDQSIV